MINMIILYVLLFFLVLSLLTVIAEMLTKRNTASGRFFRCIRIRLRELSLTAVCAASAILLIWGLIIGDDNFSGIWIAILILLTMLFVLHPEAVLNVRKRRKKAVKKQLAGTVRELPAAKEASLLKELPAPTKQL